LKFQFFKALVDGDLADFANRGNHLFRDAQVTFLTHEVHNARGDGMGGILRYQLGLFYNVCDEETKRRQLLIDGEFATKPVDERGRGRIV
jgi:hypothetical protein